MIPVTFQFDKIIRKHKEAKSAKDEKIEMVKRLKQKEAALKNTIGDFGGKVTLGKFVILDRSEDEASPKAAAPVATPPDASLSSSPSTATSVPTKQKHKRVQRKIAPHEVTAPAYSHWLAPAVALAVVTILVTLS